MPPTVRGIGVPAPVPAPAPATAAGLLALVAEFRPSVEGGALVFDLDPPPDLLPLLRVLHTGIRALLTGRSWWGSSTANGKRPQVVRIDPAAPIPAAVALLAVEGDGRWDRIPPSARLDLPRLFAPAG